MFKKLIQNTAWIILCYFVMTNLMLQVANMLRKNIRENDLLIYNNLIEAATECNLYYYHKISLNGKLSKEIKENISNLNNTHIKKNIDYTLKFMAIPQSVIKNIYLNDINTEILIEFTFEHTILSQNSPDIYFEKMFNIVINTKIYKQIIAKAENIFMDIIKNKIPNQKNRT